jgi:hypothetical protein
MVQYIQAWILLAATKMLVPLAPSLFPMKKDNHNGMKMIKIKPTEVELDEEKLMDWIQEVWSEQ